MLGRNILKVYSQRDPRWSYQKLGDCDITIGQQGCYITCLGMLSDTEPPIINAKLKNNARYSSGCLVIANDKTAFVCSLKYNPIRDRAFKYPTITEVSVPNGQHFVIDLGNGYIADPWIGAIGKNAYKIKSYRNFYAEGEQMEKIKNAEMIALPNGNLDWHIPNPETHQKYFDTGSQKITTVKRSCFKYKDSDTVYWAFANAESFTALDKWSNIKEIDKPVSIPDMTKYCLRSDLEAISRVSSQSRTSSRRLYH